MLFIPSTPPVRTFEQVCEYLGRNFDVVVQEAILLNITLLLDLTAEEVIAKAKTGREEKGGDFDLEAIPALSENREEMMDSVMYTLFHLLQRDH